MNYLKDAIITATNIALLVVLLLTLCSRQKAPSSYEPSTKTVVIRDTVVLKTTAIVQPVILPGFRDTVIKYVKGDTIIMRQYQYSDSIINISLFGFLVDTSSLTYEIRLNPSVEYQYPRILLGAGVSYVQPGLRYEASLCYRPFNPTYYLCLDAGTNNPKNIQSYNIGIKLLLPIK